MSEPLRRIDGDTLVSTATPAMRMQVDAAMPFLGSTEIVIKGIADAERHYFVEARDGRVSRMLVAQFEGFLSDNAETYVYPLPDPVDMGGETWGSWVFCYGLGDDPSPETADTLRLFERHGLELDVELIMARYARILAPEARHEVLVFYTEPLRRLGYTLASVCVDDELRLEHHNLGVELRARARRSFHVASDAAGA